MFFCCDDMHISDNPKFSIFIITFVLPLQAHIKKRNCVKMSGRRIYKTFLSGCGSASVEAAIVLPMFIFAMLGLVSAAGVIHTRGIVYEGLHETALYLAEYSFLDRQIKAGVDVGEESDLISNGLSAVTANTKLGEYIDDSGMVERYVDGGMAGLRIVQAELKSDDRIYIKLLYDLHIEIPIIGNIKIPCEERIRQRAYIGYDRGNDDDSEGTYVYVAENGQVYHSSRSCYHIRLTIRQVSPADAARECEGLSGCSLCARYSGRGTLYVTQSGDRYHFSLECPGLKRTIYRVKKNDCGDLPPCSECGR